MSNIKSSKSTKIPRKISTKSATKTSNIMKPYISFWKPQELNGLYSQWSPSKIVLNSIIRASLPLDIMNLKLFEDYPCIMESLEGTYSCAEQFMMVGKAQLFGDSVIANQIMKSHIPRIHKQLGRKVQNFDDNVWMQYAQDIVILASYLKFSQNLRFKTSLIDSGDAILIEGSPLDKIWGVGLRYDNPKIGDPVNWKGANLLGECLMKVRDIIQKQK